MPDRGWPVEHGVPRDLGRDWFHWLKNNLTGIYKCVLWRHDKQAWVWPGQKPLIPGRQLPTTWDYLGVAIPCDMPIPSAQVSAWEVVRNLDNAIAAAGSAKAWAAAHGVSEQFVSDVRHGRKEPTDRIARPLGYRRVVGFQSDA